MRLKHAMNMLSLYIHRDIKSGVYLLLIHVFICYLIFHSLKVI